ncbi:MAG: glycosyltransferase [Alphaproteobacteria bacterium]|nr:glycosyltransferase [Alphaproteobacteria bacterium]
MAQDKKQNPTFSVITVTKDNLAGLRLTHKSLEEQTCRNFEWIAIDGASADQTADFLGKTRARWISEPDEGPFDAMNKGIRTAKGEYLLFLNAGDALALPDTLENIEKITSKQPDFIYGDAVETPDSQKGQQEPFYKTARRYRDLPRGMFTHHQAMFYRHAHIREQKLRYSTLYEIAADYDFTARFLKNAKKIIYVPIPVCSFQGGGISQQRAQEGRREEFLIRERLKLVTLPQNVWIYFRQTLAWKARLWFPKLYQNMKGRKREEEVETPAESNVKK